MQLYHPDNSLPGVSKLLDPVFLRERLSDWLPPGKLEITNIRYKPNTSCLVSYRLDRQDETQFVHAKAFQADDWLIRREKFADSDWLDDQYAFAVFKFPKDTKLESVRILQNHPTQLLSSVWLDHCDFGQVTQVRTLAYKPNRRYVASVESRAGRKAVLKLHCKSSFRTANAVASTLRALNTVDFPARIGRSKRHRALAYDWIDGRPIEIAKLCPSEFQSTVKMIMDYLDRIQRPVDTRKFKIPVRSPMTGMKKIAGYLDSICHPLGATALGLAAKIESLRPTTYRPILVHGDFYDEQILIHSDQIVACDFDNLCVDDSVADIANFTAHLRNKQIAGNLDADFVGEFDELCRAGLSDQHEADSRYLWNQSAALMRLATTPFRKANSSWFEQTKRLLDEVGSVLSKLSRCSVGIAAPKTQIRLHEDHSFDFLSDIDANTATKTFQKHVPQLNQRFGKYSVVTVTPVRHKTGRRCLIEFELATDKGMRSVLGKVSAKRTDRKAAEIQRRLYEKHDFGPSSPDQICTPEVFGCCSKWQMWIQDKVAGQSASQLLEAGKLATVVDRIAPSIHKLHECKFEPSREHFVFDELKILSNRLSEVRKKRPEWAARISKVLDAAFEVSRSLNSGDSLAPIHRDFYQDQILFGDELTYLIDLDLLALGPPALDIGNFLAHLTEHGIRVHNDPYHWLYEEERIMLDWLTLSNQSNRLELECYKALSFARHIAISQAIKQRNESTPMIIKHSEKLFTDLTKSANRDLSLNTIQTGEFS